jgi:tight adherence protein B
MDGGTILFFALLGGAVFLLSQVLIVPAFGSDARTRRLLRRKLEEIDAVDADREVSSLLRQKYLRELSPLARRLEDTPHMEALGRAIEQAGLSILAHRLVALAVLAALGGAAVAMILTGNPAIAVLAFAAGGAAPFVVVCRKRRASI